MRNTGTRASQLLSLSRLYSEETCLDFDFLCTARLQVYDAELEKLRAELMLAGNVERAFGVGGSGGAEQSNASVRAEITPANFRDQGI